MHLSRYLFLSEKISEILKRLIILLFISLVIASCSDDSSVEDNPSETNTEEPDNGGQTTEEPKVLTSGELKQTFTSVSIQSTLALFGPVLGLELDASLVKYDVDRYYTEYKTTYKGKEITASGLVFLPKTDKDVSVVVFSRGTIAADSEAPSNDAQSQTLYAAYASLGYVLVVPDYIGFGSSTDVTHPYYISEATATTAKDHLTAGYELAVDKKISMTKRLYLLGYSEGGFATMSLHKHLETNKVKDLTFSASFPAAGGFDIVGFKDWFIQQTTYPVPFYIAFVSKGYETYYDDIDASFYSSVLKSPYDVDGPKAINGTNTQGDINKVLTTTIADLLTSDFINQTDNADINLLNKKLQENSPIDFVPKVPMYIYHSDADEIIPFSNSKSVYDKFIAAGASTSVVSITTISGKEHGAGGIPYINDALKKLLEIDK